MTTSTASTSTPDVCPDCGSRKVASILYGEPAWSPTLDDDIAAGRIVLGGCIVGERSPEYQCGACGSEFRRNAVKARPRGSGLGTFAVMLHPNGLRSSSRIVGRLVLTGAAASRAHPPEPALLLGMACDELRRRDVRVRFLLTPAGFLRFKVPPGLGVVGGWHTPTGDFQAVLGVAAEGLPRMLSDPLVGSVCEVAEYLVIGVDVASCGHKGRPYGETAFVIRTRDAAIVGSTGKTFPNTEQQRHLIRNVDASDHLIKVDHHRLAVLVCHDLVAFGKRSETNRRGEHRVEAGSALEGVLAGEPTVVLHLPHTIDSTRTFGPAWTGLLERHGGSTVAWASAIKYRKVGDGHRPDKALSRRLLRATSSGHETVADIVVGDHAAL